MADANTGVTSLIAWLEAITFIKLYGFHSLMKCYKAIVYEDTNKHDESTVDNWL